MRQALHDLKEAILLRQPSRVTREDRIVLVIIVWLAITIFGFVQAERAVRGLHQLSNGRVAERKETDRRGCVFVRDHVVKPDRATVENGPRASVPILRKLGFTNRQIRGYLHAQYAPGGPVAVELKRRPIPICSSGHPYVVPKRQAGVEARDRGANGCGVERAAVKHLTDGYTLGKPHQDTTYHLIQLQPPPVTPDSPRFTDWRGPHKLPEGRLVQLSDVHVIAAKQEPDSDLHVIVQGDFSNEMNVEVPAARCDSSSPYADRLAAARTHADAALGPVSSQHYTPEDLRATIRGTLFYDVLHGQRGASNGVELHPVTMFNVVRRNG